MAYAADTSPSICNVTASINQRVDDCTRLRFSPISKVSDPEIRMHVLNLSISESNSFPDDKSENGNAI